MLFHLDIVHGRSQTQNKTEVPINLLKLMLATRFFQISQSLEVPGWFTLDPTLSCPAQGLWLPFHQASGFGIEIRSLWLLANAFTH